MDIRLFAEKGQIMKQQVRSYQWEIIEEREIANGVYTLFRFTYGKLLKYAVAIEDRSGSEIAWIGTEEHTCRLRFKQIVEGELSSVHLMEVAADFCCESALEIF